MWTTESIGSSGSNIDAILGYLGLTEPRPEYRGNYCDDNDEVKEGCVVKANKATCSSP